MPELEAEPTGRRGRTATGSDRNGNEAVAVATQRTPRRTVQLRFDSS